MSSGATVLLRRAALATLIVAVCLVALLALPPIQARLARLVADRLGDDVRVDFGYLWLGPRGIDLRDVRFATRGLTIEVERADIDFALWSSLSHLGLDVASARLEGVDVRIEPAPGSAPAPANGAPPFAGLRPIVRMPARIALREVAAAGTISLAGTQGVDIAGSWRAELRDLAPDASASVDLHASVDARRGEEAIAAADIDVDAAAQLDTAASLTGAELEAELRPRERRAALRATASLLLAHDAERYALALDSTETGARLVQLDATLAGNRLDADWQANLTEGVVAAFARGRSVADLSGTSMGRARVDLALRRADLETDTQIQGSGWDAFDERLADLGPIMVDVHADVSVEPGLLDARDLRIGVATDRRGELLRIEALQPLTWHAGSWRLEPMTWGEPALRLRASALPLGWLRPFSPGERLRNGELSGALDLVRDGERRTTVHVAEPLRATGVELASSQDLAVPLFDVMLLPRASFGEGVLEADIERLTVTAATGLELDFRGHGETSRMQWPIVSFEGLAAAHVPVLSRVMPQLDSMTTMTRLQFDFSTLELFVAAANLTGESRDGRALFAADLSGQRPLRIALPRFSPDWDAFEPQSVTLRLDRMPIDWLSPYIPEVELRGGEVSGRFTAAAAPGQGLIFRTDEPLVVANLRPSYRGRPSRQAWTASVRPRLVLGNTASEFALEDLTMRNPAGGRLRGAITAAARTGEPVAVDVSVAAELPALSRRLGTTLGRLQWRQHAEFLPDLQRWTLHELSVDIADGKGSDFLRIRNLRPFFVTTKPFGVSVDGGSTRVLSASVTPLRLEDLLPSIFGFELEGVLPRGELVGSVASDGTLVLGVEEPLLFRDVDVQWDEATLLTRVTAAVEYEVAYSAEGVEARAFELTLTSPEGERLAHATTDAVAPLTSERLLSRASIGLEANLVPLSRQPILDGLSPFESGRVEARFELTNRAQTTITLVGALRDAATQTLGRLPDVDLRLDSTATRGERVSLALPVAMQSSEHGRSQLELRATASKDSIGYYRIDTTLEGDRVVVRDIDRLVQMLSPPEAAAASQPGQGIEAGISAERLSAIAKLRAQRHSVPIWSDHLRGTGAVQIDSVVLPSFTVDDVRGRLDISPARAAVTDVAASMLGGNLAAAASIDFDATRPKPYSLDFTTRVDDLAVERLFLTAAPDDVPTAEGLFELDMTLASTGLNPLDLGLSTLGQIELSGRNGVFRGLAASAGTGSTAARVIGVLTFSRELRAIGRLLDGLGELRFNEVEIELDRTELASLDLKNLLVVAPQLRLEGSGTLGLSPQRPLVQSPLEVSAQLAARGDVAVLFDGMNLLEENATNGYRELARPIEIGGSPAEPDASAFWELLDAGAENARGTFGFALRTLNRKLERGRSSTD